MSRALFQPQLVGPGESVAELNAQFRAESAALRLQFSCVDCVYYRTSRQTCTLGWPVAALCADPPKLLNPRGEPAFCKAFEPDDL